MLSLFCFHAAKATKFYLSSITGNLYRLESMRYPGHYLMIQNNRLLAGTPTNDNDAFEILADEFDPSVSRLRQSEDCYIAFSTSGRQVGPCGLSSERYETALLLVPS